MNKEEFEKNCRRIYYEIMCVIKDEPFGPVMVAVRSIMAYQMFLNFPGSCEEGMERMFDDIRVSLKHFKEECKKND